MLVVEFRFPAGRYHATPWGRQVNEGLVEWPPSPWRILRAFISTWYWKARDDIDEATMRSLILKLSTPPRYHLPEVALGHTRHYMPLYRVDQETPMIFDTFVSIRKGENIGVLWPDVDLSDEEVVALDVLLERLGYLGRAESWTEARRADSVSSIECAPMKGGSGHVVDGELVKVLAPIPDGEYIHWRDEWLGERKERKLLEKTSKARTKGKPTDNVKLTKTDIEKIESMVPDDVFNALQVDTGDLKNGGWSQPPGSTWVTYTRPSDTFQIRPRPRVRKTVDDLPTVARYVVASNAPPRLTETISVAERIHVSLVKYSDGSPVFTGCDEKNEPLKGHGHAYIFAESNLVSGKGTRGDITHITIYTTMGFGPEERISLDMLTKIWGHGGHDIQLILLGVGKPADFAGIDLAKGQCPLFSRSTTWVSRTPFVPTRHPKSTRAGMPKLDEHGLQIGGPEHDIRRLLQENGFTEPITIEPIFSTDLAGHETRWLHFRLKRQGGRGRRSTNMGFGFRLIFPEPVEGPIALGYGAHFGLGLFLPE